MSAKPPPIPPEQRPERIRGLPQNRSETSPQTDQGRAGNADINLAQQGRTGNIEQNVNDVQHKVQDR
jgi:hypothetical protein